MSLKVIPSNTKLTKAKVESLYSKHFKNIDKTISVSELEIGDLIVLPFGSKYIVVIKLAKDKCEVLYNDWEPRCEVFQELRGYVIRSYRTNVAMDQLNDILEGD